MCIYIHTHIILILRVKSRFFLIDKWWYYLCDVTSQYRTPLIDDRCIQRHSSHLDMPQELWWFRSPLERAGTVPPAWPLCFYHIYFFFDLLVFFKDWIRTWKWDRLVEEWLKFHGRSYGIWWDLMGYTYLVRGLEHLDYFSIQLGMSSSQLTFIHSIIFQTG